MNKKTGVTLIILVTLLLILGMIVKISPSNKASDESINSSNTARLVTFYDQATGESVMATFGQSSVTFTNDKLGTITLPQAISASDARYANVDESLVFWNKGDDVFITQDGKIIFNGSIGLPQVPTAKLPASSNPPVDMNFLLGTWVWISTGREGEQGEITEPNKPGVFTLKFETNGHVSGTTDCNGFGADYDIGSDGIITFKQFISTQMFCEGSQEQLYVKELSYVQSYMVEPNGDLLLLFANGSGAIHFSKK